MSDPEPIITSESIATPASAGPSVVSWPLALSSYFALGLSAGLSPPATGQVFSLLAGLGDGFFISALLVALHGIAWGYLGSLMLGAVLDISSAVLFVGQAYFKPAMCSLGITAFAWVLHVTSPGMYAGNLMRTGRFVVIVWAAVAAVSLLARVGHFGALKRTLLFLWWLAVPIVGLLVWGMVRG